MNRKKKKVFVGMSGGVDSSVAAALLKKAGFDVAGIYLKCWTEGASCTSVEDERSARLAAAHLQIPFYVWNFLEEYRKRVVEYMLKGYEKGITPNPDMMCNKEIKFGLFYEKARQLGADYIATGHYARLRQGYGRQACILKGIDQEKDQSYFLALVKAEVLARVLFPIGEYTKPQVRAFARKIGLPNADRKDSQGICFVGKVDVGDFLRLHIHAKSGTILDSEGKTLGEHDGAFFYTIGQRQGLGLPGGPYYVAHKDLESNTVTVAKEETSILQSEFRVKDLNWFSEIPQNSFETMGKLRYRQEDVPLRVEPQDGNEVLVCSKTPQRAVTPGQFVVFYNGEEVLGGGVIV